MQKRRVVITGMGAVTPVGNSIDEMWASILAQSRITFSGATLHRRMLM